MNLFGHRFAPEALAACFIHAMLTGFVGVSGWSSGAYGAIAGGTALLLLGMGATCMIASRLREVGYLGNRSILLCYAVSFAPPLAAVLYHGDEEWLFSFAGLMGTLAIWLIAMLGLAYALAPAGERKPGPLDSGNGDRDDS